MITAQLHSERTPMQKIAARSDNLSVRLLSGTAVATGVEISMCDSLGIVPSVLPASTT
jgi:hypothetical protein